MTVKIVTLARAAIAAEGLIIKHLPDRGHHYFTLQLPDGRVRKVTMAGSPKSMDASINRFRKDLKRLFEPSPKRAPCATKQ